MQRNLITVIGSPFDLGGNHAGAARGPKAILEAGVVALLESEGHDVVIVDCADEYSPGLRARVATHPRVRKNTRLKHLRSVREAVMLLEIAARGAFAAGRRVLSFGGDHSIAIGTGFASRCYAEQEGKRIGMIWIDQHFDAHTPETTESGNIHGMPLAVLLGRGDPRLIRRTAHQHALFHPRDILHIGASNWESGEEPIVYGACGDPIRSITLKDHIASGRRINALVEEIECFASRYDLLYVTVDLDAVIESAAPEVQYPASSGFLPGEVYSILVACARTGKVLIGEIVECAPAEGVLGVDSRTARFAASLGAALMRRIERKHPRK